MTEAQAAAALGFKATATAADAVTAAHGRVTGSSLKVRESLVLMREASVGNLTRMAGSATILAGSFGLMSAGALTMAAAIGAPIAALGFLAFAFAKGQEEATHLNNILAVTNGYSGVTASSFEDMASRIAKASDTGIGKTKANIEAMIASGKFTGDTIDQLVSYSAKLAQLTGQDSSKIVASFDAMKGSVVQFAVKHEETYHDLTLAQIDYIAQLEKAGKHHEAELEFAKDINTKVQTLSVQYGTLQTVMHGVQNAASSLWDAILGVGRPDTTLEKLNKAVADLKAKSDDMLSGQGSYGAFAGGYTNSPSDVNAQASVVRSLTAQLRKEQADAAAKAKAAQANDDAIQKKYGHNGARDDTAQRSASVDAAVAQAQAQELQAQLGLTTDIKARADLQQQILQAQTTEEQARIQRQIAEIEGDKGISSATKAQLVAKLQGVQATEQTTANLKAKLVAEQAYDAVIKQNLDIANAEREAQSSVLQAQEAITRDIGARQQIETKLLALADAKAVADAQAVIDSKQASETQKQIARQQIAAITAAQPYRQQLIDQQALTDTIHQQADVAQGALQNQIDILSSQAQLVDFASQRIPLDRKILDFQQQIATSKALEAVWAAAAANDQVALAKALADLKALQQIQANDIRAFNGTGYSNFEDASNAMANVASAIGSHDWAKAAHDLFDAFNKAAQTLEDSGASFAQKAGAIAGLAAGIGNAIGGQAGKTISDAAQGYQIGNTLLGPLGGVLGAIGGTIASLFGDGGKARRAKEDQQAASIASSLQSAEQQRYSQQQQQELTLAGLTGDTLKQTNVQRAQELAGLDATNRARQQEIYTIQDQVDAAQKALDAANGSVQTAVQQMTSISQAAKQASSSLGSFYASLTTGSSALNSPLRQYALTKTALVGVNSRVAAGDQSAFGDVQGSVNSFLAAAQAYAPNKQAYGRDLAFAERSVADAKAVADAQVSIAQQQLDAAQAQVGTLTTINTSVLTVAQAVAQLQGALTAQAGAQAGRNTAQAGASAALGGDTSLNATLTHFDQPNYAYYVQNNADLFAQFQDQTGYARGRDINAYGQIMWTTFDNSNRQFTPYGQKFGLGGAFDGSVGGAADMLTQPTQLRVGQGGEAGPEAIMPLRRGADGRLGVAAANDNSAALLAAIQALQAEVAALRGDTSMTARQTTKTANLLQRVTLDGEALQTELKVPA